MCGSEDQFWGTVASGADVGEIGLVGQNLG